jgi:glycosyltransferase involved in cell wall biosynthesis
MRTATGELVSVIIICFNQAQYLGEAIESALAQTGHQPEIIVVDDGSTDRTSEIAHAYSEVSYIYQNNQGISSARNTGLRACTGDHIAFLDADDRLLPKAAQAGLNCLREHPESGFTFGRYHKIDAHGVIISAPNQPSGENDFYVSLLQRNLIGMQSTVLYPRNILENVGGFNERLRRCEDYDLYLRVARRFPIHRHDEVVAEYRRHDQNMSKNYRSMLETTLRILNAQDFQTSWDARCDRALEAGIANWRSHYGNLMVQDFRNNLKKHGLDRGSIRRFGNLATIYPQGISLITRKALRGMLQRSLGIGS